MKTTRTVVGCDIKGYSNLNSREQHILTAHLEGCHIKSISQASLETIAFNDTGDGFYVIFDRDADEKQGDLSPLENYIKYLSIFYYSDKETKISEMVSEHWLKIVFGKGDIIITGQKAIRGNGINDIARILEASKLPIPLQLITRKHKDEKITCLTINDKHNKEILCEPRIDLVRDNDDSVINIRKIGNKDNMYFFLKQPFSGKQFSEIRDDEWEKFNYYLNFTDDIKSIYKNENDFNKYIKPIFIYGHSLKPVADTLNEIKKKYETDETNMPEIRLILLDPFSDYAMSLKDEKDVPLRRKIIESINLIINAGGNTKYFDEKLVVKFTNKPISIGCHKILDYIFIINYGDHHLRNTANVNLYNFFGPGNDNQIFKNFINGYLEDLWNNNHSKISISCTCYSLEELRRFKNKIKLFIENEELMTTLDNQESLLKSFDHKAYLSPLLLDRLLKKKAVDLEQLNKQIRQIEIHPSAKCNFECEFCQGKKSIPPEREIALGTYKNFLHSIDYNKYNIEKVIISGEYSEPMLYSCINELIRYISNDRKLPIGLYTNGSIDLTSALDCLEKNDNYMVLNLYYCEENIFYRVNGKKRGSNFTTTLDQVKKNLRIIKKKIDDKILTHLNINYELNKENLNESDIETFVKFMSKFEINNLTIRFNIPIVPFHHSEEIAFKNGTLQLARDAINVFYKLAIKFEDYKKIAFRYSLIPLIDNAFNRCYAFFDSIVIQSDGKVVPCCYTANAKYKDLFYANIEEDDFNSIINGRLKIFKEFDHNTHRPKYVCPACSRKDHFINSLAPQDLK